MSEDSTDGCDTVILRQSQPETPSEAPVHDQVQVLTNDESTQPAAADKSEEHEELSVPAKVVDDIRPVDSVKEESPTAPATATDKSEKHVEWAVPAKVVDDIRPVDSVKEQSPTASATVTDKSKEHEELSVPAKVVDDVRPVDSVKEESPTAPATATATATATTTAPTAQETPRVMVSAEGALKETDDNGFVFYKCRFCGLTYNYITTLKAHERVHNVQEPYVCPKCNCTFHYNCELEYHMQQHTEQKGYKCECGRTFYRYTDLLYHKHPGEDANMDETLVEARARNYEVIPGASTCSRPADNLPTPQFAERGFEPKHPLKVYSETRSKPYICQYCSKSYSDSRGLAYHMYGHRGERTFNPRASRYLMARNDYSYISPGAD